MDIEKLFLYRLSSSCWWYQEHWLLAHFKKEIEQQNCFMLQFNQSKKYLPRKWYFPCHFVKFNNILWETFVLNLISLTRSSLQIFDKTQTGVFPISRCLVNLIQNKIITPKLVVIFIWNLNQLLNLTTGTKQS